MNENNGKEFNSGKWDQSKLHITRKFFFMNIPKKKRPSDIGRISEVNQVFIVRLAVLTFNFNFFSAFNIFTFNFNFFSFFFFWGGGGGGRGRE